MPPRHSTRAVLPLALLLAASVPPALAQSSAAQPADNQPADAAGPQPARLNLRAHVSAWFAGVSGELRLPGSDSTGNGDQLDEIDELGYDAPQLSPHVNVELEIGPRWSASLRAASVSGDNQVTLSRARQLGSLPFAAGSQARTSLDFASVDLEAGYRVAHRVSEALTVDGAPQFTFRADVTAGLRVLDIDWSVARPGSSDRLDVSGTYPMPIVGVRARATFEDQFAVEFALLAGGMSAGDWTASTFDVVPRFTWMPHPNVGVHVGYRAAFFAVEDGETPSQFEFDGAQQGLMAGLSIAF